MMIRICELRVPPDPWHSSTNRLAVDNGLLRSVPLIGLGPVQLPVATQVFAYRLVHVSVTLSPAGTSVAVELSCTTGGGTSTVNSRLDEVPPPGRGLYTVTARPPPSAMSAAPIAALSSVPLTYTVGRAAPSHCTTDFDTKPVPITVNVNAGPSTVVLAGDNPVATGTG